MKQSIVLLAMAVASIGSYSAVAGTHNEVTLQRMRALDPNDAQGQVDVGIQSVVGEWHDGRQNERPDHPDAPRN